VTVSISPWDRPEVMSMVEGKWNITIKTPMGDKSGVLDLKTEGNVLTGSLSDAEHFAAISDGRWTAKSSAGPQKSPSPCA